MPELRVQRHRRVADEGRHSARADSHAATV
jgi:hypothetical protein